MHRTWTSVTIINLVHKTVNSTPPLTNIQNILKGKQETVSPWIDERKSSELMTLSVTCWLWHNRMKNTQSECIRGKRLGFWSCSFHSKEKLVSLINNYYYGVWKKRLCLIYVIGHSFSPCRTPLPLIHVSIWNSFFSKCARNSCGNLFYNIH